MSSVYAFFCVRRPTHTAHAHRERGNTTDDDAVAGSINSKAAPGGSSVQVESSKRQENIYLFIYPFHPRPTNPTHHSNMKSLVCALGEFSKKYKVLESQEKKKGWRLRRREQQQQQHQHPYPKRTLDQKKTCIFPHARKHPKFPEPLQSSSTSSFRNMQIP